MFLPQKTPIFYECKKCNFITSNKKDYTRHLNTRKHENTTNTTKNTPKNPKLFTCDCGKTYPYRSSLYNHKKTCKSIINDSEDSYKELFINMVKENKELCKTIVSNQNELNDKLTTNKFQNQIIGNNNVSIINKQKLNVNIFLNEQCKDALTMNEFIEKINITLHDLLITKEKGITEGVSNILIENMNKLSLHQRPMHCTDVKRETVYIKCNNDIKSLNNWEQDSENKQLKEALKKVSLVQQKNLDKWTEEHPNWMDDPNLQSEYMKLIKNCTDDLHSKREDKVIKKVCNKVYLGDVINEN